VRVRIEFVRLLELGDRLVVPRLEIQGPRALVVGLGLSLCGRRRRGGRVRRCRGRVRRGLRERRRRDRHQREAHERKPPCPFHTSYRIAELSRASSRHRTASWPRSRCVARCTSESLPPPRPANCEPPARPGPRPCTLPRSPPNSRWAMGKRIAERPLPI